MDDLAQDADEELELRAALKEGLLNLGLKLGEGWDRAGKPYAWLIDSRQVLLTAPYLHHAARLLWKKLAPYRPEMVGGMTMAANPLTIALLGEALAAGQPVDAFLIRREPKADGLRKQVEGPPIKPGTRVVLVDDLINSGETQKLALKALEPFSPEVVAVAVIIDYQRAGAQWLGSQGLPVEALFTLAELGIAMRDPAGLPGVRLDWTFSPLNHGRHDVPKSVPAASSDTIYVGADAGFLVALDFFGKERWRHPVRDRARGIHATPLIHAGRVYFGAYDGYFTAVDAASGALIWEIRPGQWIGSSATVDPDSGRVFVGIEYGEAGGSLIAVDPSNGKIRWELRTSDYIHSSPVFDGPRRQVIVGSNDHALYAADSETGALRWRFVTEGDIKSNPVVDEDGTCFATSFDGHLYALNARNGELRWKKRLSAHLYAHPLIHEDLVVVGGYSSRVVALDRRSGVVRWVSTTGERIVGGAATVRSDLIAIGSGDGCLYLIDAHTGETRWRYKTDAASIMSSPAVAGGRVLIATTNGPLYAFSVPP